MIHFLPTRQPTISFSSGASSCFPFQLVTMSREWEECLLHVLVPQTSLAKKNNEREKDDGAAGDKASLLSQGLRRCGLEPEGINGKDKMGQKDWSIKISRRPGSCKKSNKPTWHVGSLPLSLHVLGLILVPWALVFGVK